MTSLTYGENGIRWMSEKIVNISPSGIGWDIENETWVMLCGQDTIVPIVYLDRDGDEVKYMGDDGNE